MSYKIQFGSGDVVSENCMPSRTFALASLSFFVLDFSVDSRTMFILEVQVIVVSVAAGIAVFHSWRVATNTTSHLPFALTVSIGGRAAEQ